MNRPTPLPSLSTTECMANRKLLTVLRDDLDDTREKKFGSFATQRLPTDKCKASILPNCCLQILQSSAQVNSVESTLLVQTLSPVYSFKSRKWRVERGGRSVSKGSGNEGERVMHYSSRTTRLPVLRHQPFR